MSRRTLTARSIAARLLSTLPVIVGVATAVFLLIHLVPGDPVQAMLGESASPGEVAALRRRLGLDRPLLAQYASFLAGLATGNLGTSLRTGQPVWTTIAERAVATGQLAVMAIAMALLSGVPAGAASAALRGRRFDRISGALAVLGTDRKSTRLNSSH